MFAQTEKRLPCAKGAGATAPEGLFGLEFLLSWREGLPLPLLKESLIHSAAHLRRIFSRLLPVEKPAVRQVLPVFFAVAYEKICTESAPPH